jgi:hypothetical protein
VKSNPIPLGQRISSRRDESKGPFACWPQTHGPKRIYAGPLVPGKSLEIRRAVWLLEHGSLPAWTQHVEVVCGNPKCLNPRHLVCPTPSERFWMFVKKGEPNECWPWLGALARNGGYGIYKRHGRYEPCERSPRVAYELTFGTKPPPEVFVCHRCDNPRCCNPHHLFLGSPKDNNADMWAKGRGSKGEKHAAIMRAARARQGDRSHSPKEPR